MKRFIAVAVLAGLLAGCSYFTSGTRTTTCTITHTHEAIK